MGHPHWNFFCSIEDDLQRTFKYVEPADENFGTYSVEFVKILLAASAEADVVCTLICKGIEPEYRPRGISTHRTTIMAKYPKFPKIQVLFPRTETTLIPWAAWLDGNNPDWWKAYNSVKHQRDSHFRDANLRNAISSTAGLFALLAYLYREDLDLILSMAQLFMLRPHPMVPFSKTKYALPDFEY